MDSFYYPNRGSSSAMWAGLDWESGTACAQRRLFPTQPAVSMKKYNALLRPIPSAPEKKWQDETRSRANTEQNKTQIDGSTIQGTNAQNLRRALDGCTRHLTMSPRRP